MKERKGIVDYMINRIKIHLQGKSKELIEYLVLTQTNEWEK